MALVTSNEPRGFMQDNPVRRFMSRQPRQNSNDQPPMNDNYSYPARWNQSAVNVGTLSPMAGYNHAMAVSRPHLQPAYPPVYQQVQPHNWASTTNLQTIPSWGVHNNTPPGPNRSNDVRDIVGDSFSDIISLIDEEAYTKSGKETVIELPDAPPPSYSQSVGPYLGGERSVGPHTKSRKPSNEGQARNINVLSKLSYYRNSRLSASLPPFRAYISTYPLLCLAALCSANAYHYRQNASKNEQLVSANARIGSKAMVVKSVTCNDEKTLVFAIRGTSVLSLRDWNVNLNYSPESPAGFLDDEGNYCHSGFLRVAKAMVNPIAARLRQLLQENPSRSSFSLLITGHSAGGAVASLLYAHMMSEHVKSELTILTDCFKRVHCVTFGAPPISLLPLKKPASKEHRLHKSLFHSFINEGDPVVRAEKNYIMSLVDLLTTTPASASSVLPGAGANSSLQNKQTNLCENSMSMLKITNLGIFTGSKKPKHNHSRPVPPRPTAHHRLSTGPTWDVPPGTLSNAGRLVVLRGPGPPPKASGSQVDLTREYKEVRAFTVTDEELRKVIFGDPLMHAMEVYRRRIEALAMKAVTGRDKFY